MSSITSQRMLGRSAAVKKQAEAAKRKSAWVLFIIRESFMIDYWRDTNPYAGGLSTAQQRLLKI